MTRWIGRLLLTGAAGAYISLIVLALTSDSIIFQPQPSSYTDGSLAAILEKVTLEGRVLHLRSGDEKITALYLPNPHARYTLLFSHGNAEDLGEIAVFLRTYYDAGFSVVAYDYRGYGTSSGKPTEQDAYEDVNAAYDYVAQDLHIPPDRIIAMGRSLGCGMAVHLAARRPVAGLVLEAPFLSAFRVVTRVQLLPWDKFNNVRDIKKVHVPVLIIHGRNDQVVPFRQGEQLYEIANQPKAFLPITGAGHNDAILIAEKQYLEVLRGFAAKLG